MRSMTRLVYTTGRPLSAMSRLRQLAQNSNFQTLTEFTPKTFYYFRRFFHVVVKKNFLLKWSKQKKPNLRVW